jgi:hypothetical protein
MFTGKAEFQHNENAFSVTYHRPTGIEYAQHTARIRTASLEDIQSLYAAHLDYVCGKVKGVEVNGTPVVALPTGDAQREFLDSFGFFFVISLSKEMYESAAPGAKTEGK